MPKKHDIEIQRPWSSQLAGLVIVALLGSLVAYFVPHLSNSTSGVLNRIPAVNFQQLVALILLTAISVIYLAYYRAKFFFSTRWLVAVCSYNFMLLFIKFALSTHELSRQANKGFGSILVTALLVSLLYILAYTVLYLSFDGRLLDKKLHKALIVSRQGKVLLAMGLFVCATIVRIVLFRLPLLSNTSTSTYLSDIFKTNAALLSAVLFVMILAAVEAYAQVRRSKDLKYYFVSGVGLILIFHLWWAIFIFRGS